MKRIILLCLFISPVYAAPVSLTVTTSVTTSVSTPVTIDCGTGTPSQSGNSISCTGTVTPPTDPTCTFPAVLQNHSCVCNPPNTGTGNSCQPPVSQSGGSGPGCSSLGVTSVTNMGGPLASNIYHWNESNPRDVITFTFVLDGSTAHQWGEIKLAEWPTGSNNRTLVISDQPNCGTPITNGISTSSNNSLVPVTVSSWVAPHTPLVNAGQTYYVTIYSSSTYPPDPNWTCTSNQCGMMNTMQGF